MTRSFDGWADCAFEAVSRDSAFDTVFPEVHPGRIELSHRVEVDSPYRDFSLALMHGAVVGFPDAALLLVGPGGTGKSTTNFAAVDQGALTCGDDYVWLSGSSGSLVAHSIYGTAKAKKASSVIPPESMIAKRWRDSPTLDKRAYYVSLDRPDTFMRSARIVGAASLEISQTRGTVIRASESRDLLRKALPSTVLQAPTHQGQLLGRLTHLLAPIPSFHVTLSPNLQESGQAILELLDSLSGRDSVAKRVTKASR
ncbi:MAG: hypothetical protein HQ526_02575 [Actinobacteria bacterium]|nr:hypothetical protein [Actinomycetota bacterium]